MFRLAMFLGIAAGLVTSHAMAGQTSAGFTVGITIGGKKVKPALQRQSAPARTYTWGAAAISLTRAGFANPRRAAASDTLYWFTAERSGGQYRIAVSIASGEIVKVIPA